MSLEILLVVVPTVVSPMFTLATMAMAVVAVGPTAMLGLTPMEGHLHHPLLHLLPTSAAR